MFTNIIRSNRRFLEFKRRGFLDCFASLAMTLVVLFFVGTAYPQTVPYIADIVGEDDIEKSDVGGVVSDEERLRLIGTFKLFNPDTVPFYIWVTFENGGKFKHSRYGDAYPSVRLVDLELRYKNALEQPMVKKFSNNRQESRVKKRFGGSWLMGGGRSGKRGSRGGSAAAAAEVGDVDVDGVGAAAGPGGRGGGRGRGVYEIVFWKEDAQAYYEMELWGVLYSPDVRGAVVAGSYVENIKFEIEAAR